MCLWDTHVEVKKGEKGDHRLKSAVFRPEDAVVPWVRNNVSN